MVTKVLIIEDELTYQRNLKMRLEKEGYFVFTADNGEEGFVTAIDKKPDLILLDLNMPKMGGMNMLRKLRKNQGYGDTVPVFILTALSSADEKRHQEITELYPTYYLEKNDISLADLIEKINNRLTDKK